MISLFQEQEKEQRLRSELETELQLKDHQLKSLLEKHAEVTTKSIILFYNNTYIKPIYEQYFLQIRIF